jgi:hypothetical protein
MLFDLRGRGRRRTIQVIYLSLAVLMGGGLVFFGIGGSVSGGLFDAVGLTGNSNSSGGGSDILNKQEKTAVKRVTVNPRDAAGWAAVARIRYQRAGQGSNYDQQTGSFKEGGRKALRRAAQAWQRYLALNPAKPDSNLASLMVQAFAGLGEAKPGVAAAEIVTQARPSSNAFYTLALFAYAAGQTRKGDLAGQKAVSLAPVTSRPSVKSQVDQLKQQAAKQAVKAAQAATGGASGGSGLGGLGVPSSGG